MARALSNIVYLESPEKGVDGRGILAKNRAPLLTDGRIGDFYIDQAAKKLYGPKIAAATVEEAWPDKGLIKGDRGWMPQLAAESDGTRRLMKVIDWIGGEGTKPTETGYLGATGIVADKADALDYRGAEGPQALINELDAKADAVTYETLTALAEDDTDNEQGAIKRLFEPGGLMPFRTKAEAQFGVVPAPVKMLIVDGVPYARTSTEPAVPAAKKLRTADRWTSDGDSDSANGGWWLAGNGSINTALQPGDIDVSVQRKVVFADRAEVTSTIIPAEIKVLQVNAFDVTVDQSLGASGYKRVSKADIDSAGYPALSYIRSVDRVMPDGTTDDTNGGYWINVIKSPFRPETNGARPGNLSFDSAAAIQATINEAEASRGGWGEIKFENEDYVCNGPLRITKNFISLIGGGRDGTTIRRNSGTGDFSGDGDQLLVQAEDPTTGFVTGLNLIDLRFRNYSASVTKGAAVRLRHVLHSMIDGVSTYNFFGGILVDGGIGNQFLNGYIYSGGSLFTSLLSGSYGLQFRPGPRADQPTPGEMFMDNWNIRDGSANHYMDYGVIVRAIDGLQVTNTHTFRCNTAGWFVQPLSNSQITDILAANCYFDGDCNSNFRVLGSSTAPFGKIIITGSKFLNALVNAFRIDASCTVGGVNLIGNILLRSIENNVYLAGGHNINLTGNINTSADKNGTGNHALIRIGAASDVRVADKLGGTMQGAANTAARGFFVEASAQKVDIHGTSFTAVPTPVYDKSNGAAFLSPIKASGEFGRTVSLVGASIVWAGVSGETYIVPNTVTAFANLTFRVEGNKLTLYFQGAGTASHVGGQLELANAANFAWAAGDTLTLTYIAGAWREVSRTVT